MPKKREAEWTMVINSYRSPELRQMQWSKGRMENDPKNICHSHYDPEQLRINVDWHLLNVQIVKRFKLGSNSIRLMGDDGKSL
jgi:hypothetical protein